MTIKINFNELRASGALPSPKGVALAVFQLCQQENVNLPDLAHTIHGDPALCGQIIKMANAVNPDRNRPVASVTVDTLIIIGINAIRQAVLGFSLISSYQSGKCVGFDYSKFWSKSVGMACAAKIIGGIFRVAPPAELFSCGLLAEIGQLGLATVVPDAYAELLTEFSGKPEDDLIRAETERFGMNRRTLAGALMHDWGMPQLFVDAITSYDHPNGDHFASGSRLLKLALTFQLSAQVANSHVSPDANNVAATQRMFEIGRFLNLSEDQVASIANQVTEDWLAWRNLLRLM